MRLLKWLKNIKKPKERRDCPEYTTAHLCSRRTPTQRWTARVLYDAWGQPWIEAAGGGRAMSMSLALYPNGRTDDCIYGTIWKHAGGPAVIFPLKPSDPFSGMR